MDIVTLLGFCVAAMFLYSILKQYNPTYAIVVSVGCCVAILVYAVLAAQPVFEFVNKLSQYTKWEDFSAVFKAVAIALLTQFTVDLCKESGQSALAGRIEFAGKVAMLICAMPLFTSLTDIILELLQ